MSLTAGVRLDASLLGQPVNLSAGPIVPVPLHAAADFQTTTTPAEADAEFATTSHLATENISANGVFYSFDLTPTAAGSGTIELDPLALVAEQYDPQNLNLPILRVVESAPPLIFTVTAPEPHSMWLLAGLAGLRRRRSAKA